MRTIAEVCSELRKKTDLLSHPKSEQYKVVCELCDEILEISKANESVKGDLISRSALLDWINEQREDVTKKQVAGSDGIFTREVLVTMQRCIGTFETAINNQSIVCNDGWIPCEKELPPMPKENPFFDNRPVELYLVADELGDYPYRAFWNGKYWTDGFSNVDVTYWQPLPSLPQPYQPEGE